MTNAATRFQPDISGSAVPSGFVGEVISSTGTSTLNPGGNGVWTTIESITLTAGQWLVFGVASYYIVTTNPTSFIEFSAGIALTDNGSPDADERLYVINPTATPSQQAAFTVPNKIIRIASGSTQVVYLVASCSYSTLNGLKLNRDQSKIQALRIL